MNGYINLIEMMDQDSDVGSFEMNEIHKMDAKRSHKKELYFSW